jgi:hypothetical protein
MIYEAKTAALVTLFETELERFGRYDSCGHHDKAIKAKIRVNKLATRLIELGVRLPHVRIIE